MLPKWIARGHQGRKWLGTWEATSIRVIQNWNCIFVYWLENKYLAIHQESMLQGIPRSYSELRIWAQHPLH